MQINYSVMMIAMLLTSVHTASARFDLGVSFSTEHYYDYDYTISPLPRIDNKLDSCYVHRFDGSYPHPVSTNIAKAGKNIPKVSKSSFGISPDYDWSPYIEASSYDHWSAPEWMVQSGGYIFNR